ncbi:unnamed protein product [Schistosoma haematobium]|nr:unnamed protein product [Schistosoma haematobium]
MLISYRPPHRLDCHRVHSDQFHFTSPVLRNTNHFVAVISGVVQVIYVSGSNLRVLIIASFVIFLLGTVNCSIIDLITKIFDWIGFFSRLFIGKEPERIRGPKGPDVDLSDFLGLFFGGNERKHNGRRSRGGGGGGGNGGLLKLLFAP